MWLSHDDGVLAVRYARRVIESAFRNEEVEMRLPPVFDERRGVFVTLRKHGELRGCIGFPYPVMPLRDALKQAALSAAFNDPRFPPLQRDELSDITVEVTVLSPPESLRCAPENRPECIKIGEHGLMVKRGVFQGLLLPQVATEYGWDAETFLSQTCIKAGLPPNAWLDSATDVLVFTGQIFEEVRPNGDIIQLGL